MSKSNIINQQIIGLHNQGKTQREIKSFLHVGSDKVSSVIKHYNETGEILEEEKKERGRPNKCKNASLLTFITAQTVANRRVSCEFISKNWNFTNPVFAKVSTTTVWRSRHLLEYGYKPPKTRQKLTEAQIQKRNNFANSMLNEDIDFDKFVFSDESRICFGPDNRYIWYKRGEVDDSVYAEYEKQQFGLMVWGAIGKGFKSKLVICPRTVDGFGYRQVLRDSNFIPELNAIHGEGNWYFMQDGATPHTCRTSKQFVMKYTTSVSNWPANSPDLNPIEHLWSILKGRVHDENPETFDQFREIVIDAWNNIPQEIIDHLVDSFKARLLKTALCKGQHIVSCVFNIRIPLEEQYENMENEYEPITVIQPQCKTIVFDYDMRNNAKFTIEEDQLLLKLYTTIGPKWKKMEPYFDNRKSSQLRSRFVSLRGREELRRKKTENTESTQSSDTDISDIDAIDPDQVLASNSNSSFFEPLIGNINILE